MDLGRLSERFGMVFGSKLGGKLGGKLAPNSKKEGYQDDVKKSDAKSSPNSPRITQVRGVGVPIGQSPNTPTTHWQEDPRGHQTLPSGTRPGGGYIIYDIS